MKVNESCSVLEYVIFNLWKITVNMLICNMPVVTLNMYKVVKAQLEFIN